MATTMTTTTMPFATALLLLLLLGIAMRSELAVAQHRVPPECTAVIIGLAPCLTYLNGKVPSPSLPCCTKLGNIVKGQPECLCAVLGGDGSALGFNINKTRVLSLTEACNIEAPPVSQCNDTAPMPSVSLADLEDEPEAEAASGSDTTSSAPTSGGVAYEAILVAAFFLFAGVCSSFFAL